MGLWEDFTGWLTGRPAIYEDKDKVATAKGNLNSIKNTSSDGREDVATAIDQLNNIKGFQENVGIINRNLCDPLFDIAEDAIDGIIGEIDAKVEGIEEYNDSSLGEKILATGGMLLSKFGEGLLSVGEDIVDAGATLVGWSCKAGETIFNAATGSDFNGLSSGVEDFIETDWSHKAFEWYYDSDLAKASAITEDSGAAMLAEGTGAATGYIALGSFAAGFSGASKGTKLAKATNVLLKNSTRANTTIAAIGGFGGGVERSLQSGQDLGGATLAGLQQGATQGVMAYGVGKIGQYTQRSAAIKKAMNQFDKADDAVKQAAKALENSDELTDGMYRQAQNSFDDALTARAEASSVVKNLKGTKLSDFEGYNDALSKAARNQGQSVATNGLKSTLAADSKAIFAKGSEAINKVTTPVRNTMINVDSFGVKEGLKVSGKSAVNSVSSKVGTMTKPLSNLKSTIANEGLVSGLKSTGSNLAQSASNTFKKIGDVTGTTGATTTKTTVLANVGKVTIPTGVGLKLAESEEKAYQQFKGREISDDIMETAQEGRSMPTELDEVLVAQDESTTTQSTNTNETPGGDTSQAGTGTSQPTGGNNGNGGNGGGPANIQFRNDTVIPNNPSGTGENSINPSLPNQNQSNPTTPEIPNSSNPNTPPEGNNNNNGMSGDISTGEELVPETPSTGNNNGNIGNIGGNNGGTIGNIGNGGSTGSVIGGINNGNYNQGHINAGSNNYTGNNYGNGFGQSGDLSYENKPGTEIVGEESGLTNIGESDSGNTLDVISIDKEGGAASVSKGSNDGGAVIPTILGVGAAAGAGVAGIHYIKKKNDNQDDEYYEDDSNDNNQNMYLENYNDSNSQDTDYTQDEVVAAPQKYKAGTMNQLALDDGTDININEDNSIIAPQKEELE